MRPFILLLLALALAIGAPIPSALAQSEEFNTQPDNTVTCIKQPTQDGAQVVLICPQPQPDAVSKNEAANDAFFDAVWNIFTGAWIFGLIALFAILYLHRDKKLKVEDGKKIKAEKKKGEKEDEPKLLAKWQIRIASILYGFLFGSLILLLIATHWYLAGALAAGLVILTFSSWPQVMEIWNSYRSGSVTEHLVVNETTTFKDVGGLDEEIEELKYSVYLYKNPKEAEELDIAPPKGIIFIGPPGCGKTLLAKAVAGESGFKNFIACPAAQIGNSYVRSGAQGVKEIIDKARAMAPCAVFFDEFDALARRRGFDSSGEFDHALTALLAEMDGMKPLSGVLIMAASNREDILDEAATRPGRFDKKVIIPHPDVKGRTQILKIHAAKKRPAKDVNFELLAQKSPGFSGAALAQICNEAAQIAHKHYIKTKEEKTTLGQIIDAVKEHFVGLETSMSDFEAAIDKIQCGIEKNLVMSEEERRIVAHHEIGHALVTVEKGLRVLDKVTLVPRSWGSLGVTMSRGEETRLPSKALILASITTALGGRAAEIVFLGEERVTTGAGDDFEKASELARRMVCEWGMGESGPAVFCKLDSMRPGARPFSEETAAKIDREAGKIIMTCLEDAKNIISAKKDQATRLSELLLEKGALPGKDIIDFLKQETTRA